MGWQRDYERRLEAFPADVRAAHEHSSNHRIEVTTSGSCGCFYCCAVFPPERIEEWVDEVNGEGQTALCPTCGIDSVIGDRSGVTISRDFLEKMRAFWFETERAL